jgi:hypothetical protein
MKTSISLLLCLSLSASAADKKNQPNTDSNAKVAAAASPNAVDYATISRFRNEAFRHSEVMNNLEELADGIGPRLTNSPNQRRAAEWAMQKLTSYGLQNVHTEPWGKFGKGWSFQSAHVRMIAPDTMELIALPKAWTVSTSGLVRGQVVHTVMKSKEDFSKYKGKLAGKIVFNGEMREIHPDTEPLATRFDEKDIQKMSRYEIPQKPKQDRSALRVKRSQFMHDLNEFLVAEKAAALVEPSRAPFDGGTIGVQGNGLNFEEGHPQGVPVFVAAIEHFGRVTRLADRKVPVEIEVESQTQFTDNNGDLNAYNVIGEIPGSDLKDQTVMIGAHIDSWHGATGATDNAAGTSVMLEVVRMIQKLGLKPRRTIRIALWTGEEQGLQGSWGYVTNHLATVARAEEPKELPTVYRRQVGPVQPKPEHGKISVYFNLDSGTGKIRAVSLQENLALAPIFTEWMAPFKDLGFDTLTMTNSSASDFISFDAAGVPGIDFLQDEIEYESRTHHSNMDTYERVQRDDLMQASAIVAGFTWQAAMRDEMLPRKPLPQPEPPPKPEEPKKEPVDE